MSNEKERFEILLEDKNAKLFFHKPLDFTNQDRPLHVVCGRLKEDEILLFEQ